MSWDVRTEALLDESYLARLANENKVYAENEQVHNLPDIHHYWSNKYLQPRLERLGLRDAKQMFERYLEERCVAGPARLQRFASIGAGNCDLEIELALRLEAKGHRNFVIDCVDLNPAMLDRGLAAAAEGGVKDRIHPVETDFNAWIPDGQYDAMMANQSLHHVLRLEHLFDQVKGCLKAGGCFIVSDIIGRNGHLRWPEALQIVEEFWRKLPPSYRFNLTLKRYEEIFEDWDCSKEGFEGIRCEEILKLLLERFHFDLFFAFGNVIEPFVDRSFGPHFDAGAAWDRAFIDDVARCDELEIRSGRIKPTHMMGVLRNERPTNLIHEEPLTPRFCLREGSVFDGAPAPSRQGHYQWAVWPHDAQQQLEASCRMLKGAEDRVQKLERDIEDREESVRWFAAEVDRVNQMLEENVEWAKGLDKEVLELRNLVDERTAWAQKLEREMGERTVWALRSQEELRESREVAQRINEELEDRTRWALAMSEELRSVDWARRATRRWRKLKALLGRRG